MKKYFTLLVVLVIVLMSCQKKDNAINPLIPDVDDLALNLINTIDLSEQLETIDLWTVYPKGIIIISLSEKFIKAFDFEGNLIKDLFKEGQGPEEFFSPTPIFVHEKRNEIEIYDSSLFRSTYYDFDLNYLRTETSGYDFCTIKKDIGDGEFQLNHSFDNSEGKLIYTFKSQIVKTDTTEIFKQIDMDYSQYDFGNNMLAACGKDKIYISSTRTDNFLIDIYDIKGNLINTFTKEYKPIPLIQEDLEVREKFKTESGFDIQNWQHISAVQIINEDKNGNLWVKTNKDQNTFIWYLFDKTGHIFAKYPAETGRYFLKFCGENIYQITGNEETGYSINIYNY